MIFKTTAIYSNRIRDKKELESKLKLNEEGNSNFVFYYNSIIIAIGYERIVYGDHGPYLEFTKNQIKCTLLSKFNNDFDINKLPPLNYKYYYFWLIPENCDDLKIYLQIKNVHDLPNAPIRSDGKKSDYNRKEGYSDYRRGYLYTNPLDLKHINLTQVSEYIELKTNLKITLKYIDNKFFDICLNNANFTLNIDNNIDFNDFNTIVNLSNDIINKCSNEKI
jgi:hypothetical protein